jgi:hypothetical protein
MRTARTLQAHATFSPRHHSQLLLYMIFSVYKEKSKENGFLRHFKEGEAW